MTLCAPLSVCQHTRLLNMRKAATYLRISSDPTGGQFGIGTHRKHTTALGEARGWQLVEEYADNDTSASKERGPGTAWARMLDDAKAGKFDVGVAVDMDRLLRRTQDLVTLIEAGVRAIVQPGGSVRDDEVIAAAREAGVTMYFTGPRHFAH